MNLKFGVIGLLFVNSVFANDLEKQQPSQEAISYVESFLDVKNKTKACQQYKYKIFSGTIKKEYHNINVEEFKTKGSSETIEWAVVDSVNTKKGLHLYSFKTTNGKVTSDIKLIHEDEDWQYYFDECKAHNKPFKQDFAPPPF